MNLSSLEKARQANADKYRNTGVKGQCFYIIKDNPEGISMSRILDQFGADQVKTVRSLVSQLARAGRVAERARIYYPLVDTPKPTPAAYQILAAMQAHTRTLYQRGTA